MPWRIFLILVVIAGAYVAYTFSSRRVPANKSEGLTRSAKEGQIEEIYYGSDLRILQFYSPTPVLTEGQQATLCYGVINAKSVRIEPPVDGVSPSLNRCVAVHPKSETTYKLIAEADGKTVEQSVIVRTRPDENLLARIDSFKMEKVSSEGGRYLFTLSFRADNVDEVHLDPPHLPVLHGTPQAQFIVRPAQTTTYTLTVIDKRGRKASKQLTVKVPPEQK
jgi:hypothetical protein